jgi:hypothetical protein
MRKKAALAELRERAAGGHIVRRRDLPHPLWLALRVHFGSVAKARRVAGVLPVPRRRIWSLPRVLDELRRLHRAGVRMNVQDVIDAGRRDLVFAIYKYARSFVAARRLAGIPTPKPIRRTDGIPWDPKSVVAEIRRLRKAREPLAMSKVDRGLLAAGRRLFGGWREAVEAAGIDYATVRLVRDQYRKDEIIASLRVLARTKPRMTLSELNRHSVGRAAIKWLGSMARGIEAAELRDWPLRRKKLPLPRNQVIRRLRARHRRGAAVYEAAVLRDDRHLRWSGLSHWGRWPRVLAAARLRDDAPTRRAWSRTRILEMLRERKRRGQSLRHSWVAEDDPGLVMAATKYFGSYREAAKRVGFDSGRRKWTRQMVIEQLRKAARGGTRVTISMAGPALALQAWKLFGRFSRACRAAGLEFHTRPERATKGDD